MDLVEIKDNKVVVAQAVVQAIEDLEVKQIELEAQKTIVDIYKVQIQQAMEKAGVNKVEIPLEDDRKATLTYIPGTNRINKKVDYDALKEQGLYETFVTESASPVKAQVRISIK